MRERRSSVRSNGLVLVSYKGSEAEGKSSAFDVSGDGARLTIDKKLKTGTAVELQICLPGDSQPILVKGEVAWVKKCKEKEASQLEPEKEYFYTGIRFTVINETNKNKIIDYVYRKTH